MNFLHEKNSSVIKLKIIALIICENYNNLFKARLSKSLKSQA